MKTDKDLLKAFREQFNTGGLLSESNVLVLMGMARGEERKAKGSNKQTDEIDYKAKYEKCIKVLTRYDAGIIGMYDL